MNSNLRSIEAGEIDKEQLKATLRKIGIVENDHVAVALSFKSIGIIKGGPNAMIDALLEVVGPKGTIMMNTYTSAFPISMIDNSYVFDPESTVPYTGLVPRLFMKRRGSIRSRHPTCSVAAIGKLAQFLTDDHDERSNPFLPFERLAEIKGKFLGIGLDDRIVAIRHEAQRRAGLFVVPIYRGVLYKNPMGKTKLFTSIFPPCTRQLPELTPRLERMGAIRSVKIGAATAIIGYVDEIIESMSAILRNDPTLNLCGDISCVFCRELERRNSLYGRIRSPRLFQRSTILRQLLAFRNKLILRLLYSRVSFIDSRQRNLKTTVFTVHDAIRRSLRPILKSISKWGFKSQ